MVLVQIKQLNIESPQELIEQWINTKPSMYNTQNGNNIKLRCQVCLQGPSSGCKILYAISLMFMLPT